MKQIGQPEPGLYKAKVWRRLRSSRRVEWVPARVREIRQHEGAKRRLVCIVNGHIVGLTEWWPSLQKVTREEYEELVREQEKRVDRNWQHDRHERATAGSRRSRL